MKRKLGLAAIVLVAITASAISALWSGFCKTSLSPTELFANFRPPRPPLQPIDSTLTCTRTFESLLMREVGRDWTMTASDGGCTFTASAAAALAPVRATAAEIRFVRHRPQISFRIRGDGRISGVFVARSSGSSTLDQRALQQIQNANYGRHNCGICRVSTLLDIDYDGPIWIRDTVQ